MERGSMRYRCWGGRAFWKSAGKICLLFSLLFVIPGGAKEVQTKEEVASGGGGGGEQGDASEGKGDGLANAKYTVVTHSTPRPPHRTDYVRMRDKAGTLFECVLPSVTTTSQDMEQAAKASKDEEEARAKKQEQEAAAAQLKAQEAVKTQEENKDEVKQVDHPSFDSFLAPLVGRCFLRNEGYWNIEVCHRKRIRQFHEENRRTSVEYSLGDFDKVDQPQVATAAEAKAAAVKHYYAGGTNCDETSSARHSVVIYQCSQGKENQIESIKEVETCSYQIVFLTPLLCNHPLILADNSASKPGGEGDSGGSGKAELKSKSLVSDYLAGLSGTCFYRVEGWWTYEFCYQKHLKQFHQENNVNTAEFILGVYSDALKSAEGDAIQSDDGSKDMAAYYIQHYSGGTQCDVTGEPRTLQVHFKCATDSLNVIVSVKEKSTCKYILVFYTPLICNHPQFQTKQDVVRSIECYPVPPNQRL